MTDRDLVRDFLLRFKNAAGNPGNLIILRKHPDSPNAECLLELGLTEMEAKREIFNLKVEEYSSGPEDDRDRQGQEVWIFCRKVQGREVYIKLVFSVEGRAKVLSFHFPKFPMKCPLIK